MNQINPISDSKDAQSISDDQELAKVLAGVTGDGADPSESAGSPVPPPVAPPTPMPTDGSMPMPPVADGTSSDAVATPPADVSTPEMPAPTTTVVADGNLASIKQEAIGELRPLVDKLEVSPEEKFDTYLLLIRSTDDQSLIAPAHTAAQSITDETRRAQALLDIIKEIDFLSQSQK